MTELPLNSKVTGSGRLVRISLVIGNYCVTLRLLWVYGLIYGAWN